jgi:hypothetical protein
VLRDALLLLLVLVLVLVLLLLLLPGNYVIVKSRNVDTSQTQANQTDPETGTNLCLMDKHYILMPTAACTGVDDNRSQCTGAAGDCWGTVAVSCNPAFSLQKTEAGPRPSDQQSAAADQPAIVTYKLQCIEQGW